MTEKNDLKRDELGQWLPGQSANPAGRSSELAKWRAQISEHIDDLLETLIFYAKNGDVQAAKLLLERVMPALKPRALPQQVPGLVDVDAFGEQGKVVIRAVALGELSIDDGAALLTALGTHAKLIEVEELEKRIAALEGTKS